MFSAGDNRSGLDSMSDRNQSMLIDLIFRQVRTIIVGRFGLAMLRGNRTVELLEVMWCTTGEQVSKSQSSRVITRSTV